MKVWKWACEKGPVSRDGPRLEHLIKGTGPCVNPEGPKWTKVGTPDGPEVLCKQGWAGEGGRARR